MDPAIWDVTALRRLLCWANESHEHEEQRIRRHKERASNPLYLVGDTLTDTSVDALDSLFALEDTRDR